MLTFKRPLDGIYQVRCTVYSFHGDNHTDRYYGRDPSGQWWHSERVPELLEAIAGRPPMVDVAGMPMPSMVCRHMDASQLEFFLKNYWPKLEGLEVDGAR